MCKQYATPDARGRNAYAFTGGHRERPSTGLWMSLKGAGNRLCRGRIGAGSMS